MLEHWHTGAMTPRATVLDALEPEAVASLNPFQLRTMGLEPGDMVTSATRPGELALNVRAARAVPEGMVFISSCSTQSTAHLLNKPQPNPLCPSPALKSLPSNGK